jgi:hypothetical protein
MNRNDLDKRLRELGIYSDFYMRRELKALPQLLEEGEQLNCILTGVHEAERKMLAVTDRRLIVIFASALSPGDIQVIPREAVGDWHFEKKLLFSSVSFSTQSGTAFTFTNTQGSLKELFEWAMQQPVK